MLDAEHIKKFQDIVGEKGLVTDADCLAPHLEEWRGKFYGKTDLMLCPTSASEVAAILKHCNEHDIKVVPQGGNTGLVGGSLPGLGSYDEILISTKRLSSTPIVNASELTITADAGCTVLELQQAASEHGLLFPLSLASEGSCTVGGVISTNAGGVHVMRYGTTRGLTLGLEAVFPSGEVINNLSGLRKDNTGYPLDQLLIGAEGTLGVVTRATFKLVPAEVQKHTLWLAIPTPSAAIDLLASARRVSGDRVSVFELLCEEGLGFVLSNIAGTRSPVETKTPWYLLVEFASSALDKSLDQDIEAWVEQQMLEGHILDGAIASSNTQANDFWRLRESMSEAQKIEGGSIKHDISVPVSAIPDFIRQATDLLTTSYPGCRVTPFGHVGDGNLHFNVMQPKDSNKEDFLAQWESMNRLVHDTVVRFGGSISAEHGIGSLKKAELARTKTGANYAALRSIKAALDPNNIMNPNVLF